MKHPNTQTGGALRVRSLGQLLNEPGEDRELILTPWLHQRHLNLTYAPTGVGKSMFTLSIAIAVAGGGSYLGWSAPKPRKVLVIDGEMDVQDLKERAALLLNALDDVDAGQGSGNLHFLARQDQTIGSTFPDLADPAQHSVILDMVERTGAELVVLDNFSTLATVDDENAASAFNPILDLLAQLKLRNAACILVHHARKGQVKEGAYRGSSKLGVVFNSITSLDHPDGIPSQAGTSFELKWEKYRGKRDATIRPLTASLEEAKDGISRWTFDAAEGDLIQQAVRIVRSGEVASQNDLAARLCVSPPSVSRLKAKAVRQGLITPEEWTECLKAAMEPDSEPDPF